MPSFDMTKSRKECGEVAWDLIWRDRIKAEERCNCVRINLEDITGKKEEP